MASDQSQFLKVLWKLIWQSWIPAVMALAYAGWDFWSMQASQRTAAVFVKSWAVAFFLIMWFVGQWFRTSKQLSDSEHLGSLREGMNKSLGMLQDLTEAAAAETANVVRPAGHAAMGTNVAPSEAPVERVLAEIPKSPKGALLILGAELERELRELLWSSGWIQGVGKATITRSVEHLMDLGVVPKNLGSSVKAFLDIRNRLLHGYGVTDDEVLRAIDIGLTILRAVLAIPREENRVYHPGVEIYEDRDGLRVRPGIKGVILETLSPGGATSSFRIFPTTRTNFVKGQWVSWEWNMRTVVDESWYRNPETGSMDLAWSQSTEFVGRSLDDV